MKKIAGNGKQGTQPRQKGIDHNTTILKVDLFLVCHFTGVKDEAGADVYRVGYTWSTAKQVAGTTVYYTHEKNEDADKVFIPGPTNEHLYVYVSIFVLVTKKRCPFSPRVKS